MSTARPSDELHSGRPSKRTRSEPSSTAAAGQLKDLGMLVASLLDANNNAHHHNNNNNTQPSPATPEKLSHVLLGAGSFLHGVQRYHLTHRFIALRLFLSVVQLCTHDVGLVRSCLENLLGVLRDGPLCSLLLHLHADQEENSDGLVAQRASSATAMTARAGSGRQSELSSNKIVVERCLTACRTLGAAVARYHSAEISAASVVNDLWSRGDDCDDLTRSDVDAMRALTGLALLDGVLEGSPKNDVFLQGPCLVLDRHSLLHRCIEQSLRLVEGVTLSQTRSLSASAGDEPAAPPPSCLVAVDAMEVAWVTALTLVGTMVRRRSVTGGALGRLLCAGFTMISWALRLPGLALRAVLPHVADCLDVLISALAITNQTALPESVIACALGWIIAPIGLDIANALCARIKRQCRRLVVYISETSRNACTDGPSLLSLDMVHRIVNQSDGLCHSGDDADVVRPLVHQLTDTRNCGVDNVESFLKLASVVPQLGAVIAQHPSQNSPWLGTMCALALWCSVLNDRKAAKAPSLGGAEGLQFLIRGGWLTSMTPLHQRQTPCVAQYDEEAAQPPPPHETEQQHHKELSVFVASAAAAAAKHAAWTSLELLHVLLQAVLVSDDVIDVVRAGLRRLEGDDSRACAEVVITGVIGDDVAFAMLRFAFDGIQHQSPCGSGMSTRTKLHTFVAELLPYCGSSTDNTAALRWRVCSLLWLLEGRQASDCQLLYNAETASSLGAPGAAKDVLSEGCRAVVSSSSQWWQRCGDDVFLDALRWASTNRIAQHLCSELDPRDDEVHLWLSGALRAPPTTSSTVPDTARPLLLNVVGVSVLISFARKSRERLPAQLTHESAPMLLMEALAMATSHAFLVNRVDDEVCLALMEHALRVVLDCEGFTAPEGGLSNDTRGQLAATFPFAIALLRNVLECKAWHVDVLLQRRLLRTLFPLLVNSHHQTPVSDDSRWTHLLRMLVPPNAAESVNDLGVVLCRHHADQIVAVAVMDNSNGDAIMGASAQASVAASVLPNTAYLPAAIACCLLESVDANRDPISVSNDVPSSPRGRGKIIEDAARNVYRWELLTLAKGCEHHFSNIVVNLLSLIGTPLSDKYNGTINATSSCSPISEKDLREAEVRLSDAVYVLCGLGSLADRPDGGFTAAVIDRACAQQAKPADPTRASNPGAMKAFKQRLLRSLFDILHTILKRMHFEDDGVYRANPTGTPVCASTTRRWLAALAVLARVLREDVIQLMQKLPAILHFAQRGGPTLVDLTAVVWRNVIHGLPTSFASTNTAALLAELVALESQVGLATTVACLQDAARSLYSASHETSSFWASHCTAVLSSSNAVKVIVPLLPPAVTSGAAHAAAVLRGFAAAMGPSHNNTSTTCKIVFLQGLRDFLASRPLDELLMCADIVNNSTSPISIHSILAGCLRCTAAARVKSSSGTDVDDNATTTTSVPYLAAQCLGLLGGAPINPQHDVQDPQPGGDGASSTSPADSQFSLLHMFEWRQMLHALLGVHLVRALASTSDSTMHDRAALAIQSLLRSGVKHERVEARSLPLLEADRVYVDELDRYWWWSKLPSLTKTLLSPFTSTKYTPFVRSTRTVTVPEFHPAATVEDWLFSWYCSLTERLAGTLVGEVALACRNTAKKDVGLRDCLLPHMVLRTITQPSKVSSDEQSISDVASLVLEFKSVFAAAKTHPVHAQRATMMLDAVEEMWTFTKLFSKKQASIACTVDKETLTQWGASLTSFFTAHDVISFEVRSRAAAECGLFHRSIRVLEGQRCVPSAAQSTANNPQLLRCYASLGDDVVAAQLGRAGCGTSTSATLDDAASLVQTGQWDLARRAAERYLQHHPTCTKHQLILVRCMRHLGETHLTTRYVRSVLSTQPATLSAATSTDAILDAQRRAELHALGQEASWRMGEWDDGKWAAGTPKALPPRESLSAPIKALIDVAQGGDSQGVAELLRIVSHQRQGVVDRIVTQSTSGDTTERALLEDLCVLADVEAAGHHLTRHRDDEGHCRLLTFLVGRADRADPTAEIKETLLSLRRVLFRELGRDDVASSAWVEEAKAMRKRSKLDAALQAVQHAAQGSATTCIKYYAEAAKLWHMKDPTRGIEFAEAVVRTGSAALPAEVTAKMILYATKWQHELVPQSEEDVAGGYRRALQLHDGAKGHLFLAQFYDSLYDPIATASAAAPTATKLFATAKQTNSADVLVTLAIRHYAKSLVHSANVSSIALPRAMTLWLEHSALMFAEMSHVPAPHRPKVDASINELNALMESYFVADGTNAATSSKVSPILTMQALPQLISRLAHAHQGTTASIAKILLSLLSVCPQQVLWALLPVVRSIKQPRRAAVAKQQVAQLFQRRGLEESRLVESVSTVFTAFLDICNASPDLFNDPRVRLTQMPFIRKVEKAISSSRCILPITSNISPEWSTCLAAPSSPTFNVFDDSVEVMSSLQKPKRIAVIGSDGIKYPFLCKAKDDPKKDIRMMEIVNRMNLLFQQDPESRKRHYRLRGYVVAALGDDYALIEWVSHQCALRRAVDDAYSVDGTGVRTATVRTLLAKIDGKTLTRMDMFKKHILVDAKPVFHQWFYHKFEDAAKWYAARQRYTVSCALWCAVGHIVGLGDRHGENMLIDTNTGEAMHVDFACMFDKGESLQEPERVRFRLTQNVVDALGVLGVDGSFRSTFETALRTQFQHKSGIMCVLETLLHDPLIEWGAKADPRQLFHRVRRRLEGYLDLNARNKEFDPAAQDASTQTTRLIQHATHWDNLSMMYIWWMAWV
jgi:hypothetical protein